MSQTRLEFSRFTAWLRDRIAADGRSIATLGTAMGDRKGNRKAADKLRRLTGDPPARPWEQGARELAAFFGADPDDVAAMAGYGDRRKPAPSPIGAASIRVWARAALEARGENPGHATRRSGVNFSNVLAGKVPDRPTLDRIADYFGVDRAELRALRFKRPDRVEQGRRLAAARGPDKIRALMAKARAARRPKTAEEKRAIIRFAVAASRQKTTPEQRMVIAQLSAEARRRRAAERGSRYVSPETRARALAKIGAASVKTHQALRARLGPNYLEYLREGARNYHKRMPPAERDRVSKQLRVGRAILRLGWPSVDPAYRQKQEPRARAQLAELRKNARPVFKKRSKFLRDLDVAEKAAQLKAAGRSYSQVAQALYGSSNETSVREAKKAVQMGRVLRLGGLPRAS